MNLFEIATRIDKSEFNKHEVNIQKLGELFGLDVMWNYQTELTSYWVRNWECGDELVGYKIYFLGDVPACYSQQTSRKSEEIFYWFSKSMAEKVRDFLISLSRNPIETFNFKDISEDVSETYKLNSCYQITGTNIYRAKYKGEGFLFLGVNRENETVAIRNNEGETLVVQVRDLDFSYNIN